MLLDADGSSGGFGWFDVPPFSQDGFASAEVDISRCQVADALVVAMVVAVVDEGGNGYLKFALEEVVFEQDEVPQGLAPALDVALGLGIHRRAANMFYAFVFEVFGLRYVTVYNHQVPQPALAARTPFQAMKDWDKLRPQLFRKQPYYLTGCDIYRLTSSLACKKFLSSLQNQKPIRSIIKSLGAYKRKA